MMNVMYLNSAPMGTRFAEINQFYLDYLRKRWAGKLTLRSSGEVWKSEFRKYKGWPEYAAGFIGHSSVPRFEGFVLPAEDLILDRGLPPEHAAREKKPRNIHTWHVVEKGSYLLVNRPTAEIVKAAVTDGRPVKIIGPGFEKALMVDWVKFGTEVRFDKNGEEYDADIGCLIVKESE